MVQESEQMPKLMPPRQTLLGCARNQARSLWNKLKYDFFDRLEDGSLQIVATGEKEEVQTADAVRLYGGKPSNCRRRSPRSQYED
jgi:hypothetical protein